MIQSTSEQVSDSWQVGRYAVQELGAATDCSRQQMQQPSPAMTSWAFPLWPLPKRIGMGKPTGHTRMNLRMQPRIRTW